MIHIFHQGQVLRLCKLSVLIMVKCDIFRYVFTSRYCTLRSLGAGICMSCGLHCTSPSRRCNISNMNRAYDQGFPQEPTITYLNVSLLLSEVTSNLFVLCQRRLYILFLHWSEESGEQVVVHYQLLAILSAFSVLLAQFSFFYFSSESKFGLSGELQPAKNFHHRNKWHVRFYLQ